MIGCLHRGVLLPRLWGGGEGGSTEGCNAVRRGGGAKVGLHKASIHCLMRLQDGQAGAYVRTSSCCCCTPCEPMPMLLNA